MNIPRIVLTIKEPHIVCAIDLYLLCPCCKFVCNVVTLYWVPHGNHASLLFVPLFEDWWFPNIRDKTIPCPFFIIQFLPYTKRNWKVAWQQYNNLDLKGNSYYHEEIKRTINVHWTCKFLKVKLTNVCLNHFSSRTYFYQFLYPGIMVFNLSTHFGRAHVSSIESL